MKMSRAQNLLKAMEEKGLLKATAKAAAAGAGGAILIHLGKKIFGKKDKNVTGHAAARRRADYE